jgi:lysozyme
MNARTPQMPRGIDVSHWQGSIDWTKTKQSGVSFAFIKATEGSSIADDTFARNYSGCKSNGILVGAYHFGHASNDPTQEANFFCKTVAGRQFDLPVVLDIEIADGKSKTDIIKYVRTWITTVETVLQTRVILYSGGYFAKTYLSSFGDYPLWLAQYTDNTTPMAVDGFADWTFWQFTQSGRVLGVNGNVDVNVFNGTLEELKNLYYTLKPEIANAVIKSYIQPAYAAATTPAEREKAHQLANELRKASGQPQT